MVPESFVDLKNCTAVTRNTCLVVNFKQKGHPIRPFVIWIVTHLNEGASINVVFAHGQIRWQNVRLVPSR